MKLGNDNHAYKALRDWFDAFDANPKKWTYWSWHVGNRRHEFIDGTYRSYANYLKKKRQASENKQ